jgi:hypothetical protein
MDNFDAPALVRQLAERYALRYLEVSRHYLGIHEGLCIDAFEYRGEIHLHVFSPAAVINSQILEGFTGFSHIHELGVPTDWVKVSGYRANVDANACAVELSQFRLRQISIEQVLAIPDCLAKDFQLFGAAPVLESCGACGAVGRTNLMYVNGFYHIACDHCLMDLRGRSPQGILENPAAVRWPRAAGAILLATVVFALLWGLLQQPQKMDGRMLLLAPFLAAIGMARFVAKSAGGTSLTLRLATLLGTVVATLAGNIWGFRTSIEAQHNVLLTWTGAADLYFNHQLRLNSGVEGIYLFGAAAGAWLGNDILRSMGFTKFE